MSTGAALLLFPFRPSAASLALARSKLAWMAPLVPAALWAGYLKARGCRTDDAAAAGAGMLLVIAGLVAGGLLGTHPARRMVLRRSWSAGAMVGPCATLGSWTPAVFVLLLLAFKLGGAGPKAALLSGLLVLAWGIAAGVAVLTTDEEPAEGGRAIVASCSGLAVSLMGLWVALLVVTTQLVLVVPAPVDIGEELAAGDLVLVRVTDERTGGALVLWTSENEAVLAHTSADGAMSTTNGNGARVGSPDRWRQKGRVFFRFGGAWGGRMLCRRHSSGR